MYVIVALALSAGLLRWDEADPIALTRAISAGSAGAALSALGSGVLAFTGFVTSIVLLIIQFGTSEFSPRFLGWFRTDPTLRYALSAFIATLLFALVSTAQMGLGTAAFVPTRTLIAALLLTLLSIAMFLLLIDRTSNNLRVAHILQSLDGEARAVFDNVYSSSASQAAAAEETARSLRARPAVQTVHNSPVGSVLVTLDRPCLVSLAESHDAVIELVYAAPAFTVWHCIPPGDDAGRGAPVRARGGTRLSMPCCDRSDLFAICSNPSPDGMTLALLN